MNYRKLVGDLNWPNDTSFKTALRGFLPTALLVLRTIKGGPVVAIDEKSPNVQKAKIKEDWFKSGDIGLIQFVPRPFTLKPLSLWMVIALSFVVLAFLFKFIF